MPRRLALTPASVLAALAVALPAAGAAGAVAPATASAAKIVVKAKQKSVNKKKVSVTYSSSKGSYTATWLGIRHYRLTGKINGRKLTGEIRTKQVKGDRYTATGSGRLGSRKVKITGGGPNSLKTATLILQ